MTELVVLVAGSFSINGYLSVKAEVGDRIECKDQIAGLHVKNGTAKLADGTEPEPAPEKPKATRKDAVAALLPVDGLGKKLAGVLFDDLGIDSVESFLAMAQTDEGQQALLDVDGIGESNLAAMVEHAATL